MADKLLAEWFWTDRWTGSSAFGLSLEARGLYREMLTQAWRRGGRLPNDHDQIRRITGVTLKEWRRTWLLVERYWRVDGDALVNDTQLEVYGIAEARTKRATDRGQKGAEKRWTGNAQASAQASIQALPEQKPPSPSLSPSLIKEEHVRTGFDVIPDEDPQLRRAGRLLERYAELFYLHRHGARYHNRMHLDFPKACELVKTWPDDARLEKLAVIVLTSDDEWIAKTDRGFGVFASRASWADDRLSAWEKEHATA